MPTKPREQSESGFYHVMQRGVCRFDIFEDDCDRKRYLKILAQLAQRYSVELHAWSLLSNHSHLLLRAKFKDLSSFMRQLGSLYARYFNRHHGRSGPLFEGRFCSVAVKTTEQFVTVMRYIHRNAVHHGICNQCDEYPWSSYGEYATAAPDTCIISFGLSLFENVGKLIEFHDNWDDGARLLDIDTVGRMGDEEARTKAHAALKEAGFDVTPSLVGTLPRKLRDRAIACMRDATACSLRQLQRLTSIAYSAIRSAVSGCCDGDDSVTEAECRKGKSPLSELKAAMKTGSAPLPVLERTGDIVALASGYSGRFAPAG